VRVKTGNIKGKDILSLWGEHLCYCIAHGEQLNSRLFGQTNGIYFEALPSDYAYQKLAELIALYEQGLQSPLPFFIESAYAWALAANKSEPECYVLDDLNFETRAEAQTAALAVFANSRGFSEGSDPYIQRCYDNLDDHWLSFEALAMQIFKPILGNISEIDYGEGEA